ncbi:MAG TPA: molybdopterin-dependent oxidoreductase, partial [Candidatus Limiplasma sp.]|nr:molybdopterin-dependent oxidoreductase [Candidatus Limiplasma sp.]
MQKFARGIIGTNNVDHSLGAHRHRGIDVFEEMLGVTAATSAIGELQKSDVILVDGVDLSWQLPTIGGIVIRRHLAGAKLIVIDPRRHRVAEHADHFMQIRPGNDILLYGAMAKVIVDRGLANLPFIKEHCTNYEAFLENVHAHDVLKAADQAGVSPEVIEEAAIAYATARAGMILYSTGVEARGPEVIRSIVNLALLTGHLGREGAG